MLETGAWLERVGMILSVFDQELVLEKAVMAGELHQKMLSLSSGTSGSFCLLCGIHPFSLNTSHIRHTRLPFQFWSIYQAVWERPGPGLEQHHQAGGLVVAWRHGGVVPA